MTDTSALLDQGADISGHVGVATFSAFCFSFFAFHFMHSGDLSFKGPGHCSTHCFIGLPGGGRGRGMAWEHQPWGILGGKMDCTRKICSAGRGILAMH